MHIRLSLYIYIYAHMSLWFNVHISSYIYIYIYILLRLPVIRHYNQLARTRTRCFLLFLFVAFIQRTSDHFCRVCTYPLRTAGLIEPALYSASVPLWGDRKFFVKKRPPPRILKIISGAVQGVKTPSDAYGHFGLPTS